MIESKQEEVARLPFIQTKGFITLCGMLILMICVVSIVGFATYSLVMNKPLTPIDSVITFLAATTTGLLGYWWGDSNNKNTNDCIVNNITSNEDNTIKT